MDLPNLIAAYVAGKLLDELSTQESLLDARHKVIVYYMRLSVIPTTDHLSNMISLLLDMQDQINAQLTILFPPKSNGQYA